MTINKAIVPIIIGALFLLGAASAFDASSYRYMAPIEVSTPGYVFFNVPPQVYDNANPNLSDLRVLTENNAEIPYVIWSNTKTSERKRIETQILNTSYIPQSYTTFTLDLGETAIRTNSITITTTSTDFVRRITIEGSVDNRKFAFLKKEDYIFDLSTEHNIKNLTVSYPTTDFRYIKVTIWDDGEQPLTEVGGDIYLVENIKGESTILPNTMHSVEKKSPKSVTEITLDLSFKNIPSTMIELSVSDRNFKREVRILSANTDDPAAFTERVVSSIYSVTTPRFSRTNTIIEYHEIQARYLKIVIENGNDAPLFISGITVSGVPRKLTFSAQPASKYFLYFGNTRTTTPSYDIAELFSYIDRTSIVPISLGSIIDNPGYIPGAELPLSERYPWILWGAIIIMVAVLGAIIIRMMVRLTKESKQ